MVFHVLTSYDSDTSRRRISSSAVLLGAFMIVLSEVIIRDE
jgi:hypothetical protein